MPDIKTVVTRDSVSTSWPAEQNLATETFAVGTITKAMEGYHNCDMDTVISEDGLSKEIIFSFPTSEDRDTWWTSEFTREGYADFNAEMIAINDDANNPVTYWTGNAEDYPG